MVNPGGRPAGITTDDLVRVGRRLGMRDLSISAVAAELGVSGAALYRHVESRWDLERLVGESILADLILVDEQERDLEQHLVAFGLQLHDFVLAHPGIGAYLQQLFPRGEAGRALLVAEVEALARRGYDTEAALAVTNAMAGTAIGLSVSEERKVPDVAPEGYGREVETVVRDLVADEVVGAAHEDFPYVDSRTFVGLVLAATARGLVATAPPGRALDEVVGDLARRGGLDGTVTR